MSRKTGSSGASDVVETSHLCANPASCRVHLLGGGQSAIFSSLLRLPREGCCQNVRHSLILACGHPFPWCVWAGALISMCMVAYRVLYRQSVRHSSWPARGYLLYRRPKWGMCRRTASSGASEAAKTSHLRANPASCGGSQSSLCGQNLRHWQTSPHDQLLAWCTKGGMCGIASSSGGPEAV